MSAPVSTTDPARPLLATTWAELRRRKVVRVAIAYVIVAWVALQVGEVTLRPLGAPDWVMTWAVLAAILGLPVALVLSWYFDATSHGIEREPGARTGTVRLFVVGVTLLTVAGVGYWLAQVYEPRADAAPVDAAPKNSIAVLPFDDMSATRDQGWLADGIAEELLDRLARIEGLRVAARTSSFAFRGRADDVREIGQALDVALLLEGSVRKAGGKIRVTAQLIDASDGFHLWSETYERGDEDIFALQDEVTAAIAAQLEKRVGDLGRLATSSSAGASADDARALELYLEARQQWRKRTPASLEQARALFERSLEESPDFARANAGLADTYLLQVDYGLLEPNEAAQLAEPFAVKAVTLDPKSGEAWATLGLLRVSVGQLDSARSSFEQAIELDPRYEMAPMWLAGVYGRQGKFDEQRRVLEQALALNPLEPVINGNLAQTLAATGKHDEAVALLERVLAVTPDDDLLLRTLATTELQAGRLDRGVRAAARAHAIDASAPANVEVYGEALVLIEDFVAAERVLAPLPPGSRVAASARQVARFARGDRTVEPTLEALADALSRAPSGSEDDRELLTLAGAARLVAGDAAGAARMLGVAAGSDPDAIGEEPSSLEPASLLILALEQIGEAEPAAKWRGAVESVGQQWMAAAGGGVNVGMARAMFASMRGDADAAVSALEAAYAAGFRERWRLSLDPRLARIAEDPRVRALDRRISEDLLAARGASRN